MALDPGERLFAGVVLIVIGLMGLVYRLTDYGMIIGDIRTGSIFILLSLIISAVFIIVVLSVSFMTRFEKTQKPELT